MKYLISSLFLFALFACQKDISSPGNTNDHEKRMRFFSGANSKDLSAKLYAIIKDIRVQDSLHNFIPTLVDKIGFPVWEKVATNEGSATLLLGGDEDSAIFMIPFKAANGDIVAYLSCIETSGNILYSLHTRDVILSRINHADSAKRFDMAGFALVLAYFEKAVNNRDSLLLAGCKLPRYRNASLHFTKPTKPTILSEFLSVTICGEVWIPATGEVTGSWRVHQLRPMGMGMPHEYHVCAERAYGR